MKKLPKYPVVEWIKMPQEIKNLITDYCRGMDLHPHNGTYIDYDVSESEYNGPLISYFYSIGIIPTDEKVLIHFDY